MEMNKTAWEYYKYKKNCRKGVVCLAVEVNETAGEKIIFL